MAADCTSDSNSGSISDPNAAGSAFMELQLYPPGYTPFMDNTSCSRTQWCAALTIDSLECTFNFATCNANCEEPVNFAYLQTNGVPAGQPSNCFQQGARTADVNGVPTTEWSDANQCTDTRYQNGDLDFDGLSYIANSWPDGTRNHPTAFEYAGPFQANRRGLHGPAGQRAVLPVLVAQPAVRRDEWPRGRVRVELWEHPAEHPEFSHGCGS